jgi:hypothetical protein
MFLSTLPRVSEMEFNDLYKYWSWYQGCTISPGTACWVPGDGEMSGLPYRNIEEVQENFDKRDKKSTDNLPAYTLFPANGCQIAWKSQVK